jgi:two-component system chemotaxis response regulator CheB
VTSVRSVTDRVDAVVIGTSAGGVEALSVLLPALPATLRVPIFIVLHIPRDRPSLLAGLFAHRCTRPVREAEDKEPVEPGTVYIAPPDYHLLLEDGPHLALSADDVVNFSRPSIDVLFESASDVYRDRLMGILMTGASHDGAAGLETVQRAGGVAVVQEPSTAMAPTLVQAALARIRPDHILPLPEIAQLLGALGERRVVT